MKNKCKQRKSSILGGCIIVDDWLHCMELSDWLMADDWKKVHGANKNILNSDSV